jgi:small nuclear ribonucleoprotein (snRNP)-like protein
MKLVNETVQIELKNGSVIQGTITGGQAARGRRAAHAPAFAPPPALSRGQPLAGGEPWAARRGPGHDEPATFAPSATHAWRCWVVAPAASAPERAPGVLGANSIAGVDIAMNTHLKNVKLMSRGKNPVSVDQMSVRGSNIRCAAAAVVVVLVVVGRALGARLEQRTPVAGRAQPPLASPWLQVLHPARQPQPRHAAGEH